MKTALDIISFISYSSNTEISKVSSWGNVKTEALNGLNRAIRVLWNSKEWNFRREIKKYTLTAGKDSISKGKYLLAQNGVRIDGTPIIYDKNIPFYEETKGVPNSYYVNNKGKIIFYPTPAQKHTLTLEIYNNLPIVAKDGTTKELIDADTDTLNIMDSLENLFIDCLTYFCNEILNGDPTDEEYQEHQFRCSEVYRLLEKADLASFDNDDSKGFLMPWQL